MLPVIFANVVHLLDTILALDRLRVIAEVCDLISTLQVCTFRYNKGMHTVIMVSRLFNAMPNS